MASSKKISPYVAMAIGLGSIIGAGIFVLSGTAISLAGSGALLAFILVGIIALIVALELGELGSILPKERGASYSYAYKAFGSELGFITGVLFYFSMATSISVIALGFGSYLTQLTGLGTNLITPFAIIAIAILSLINLGGLKRATNADVWLVAFKVAILVLFIIFALAYAFSHPQNISLSLTLASLTKGGLQGIFEAGVIIIFAYSGFQTISTLTPRISGGPEKAAKAILMAVAISIVLYVLVTVGLLALAPASAYTVSGDPLAFALTYAHAPSWMYIVVDIAAIVATLSAVLAIIIGSSRLLYQIGEDHLIPKISRVYDKKRDVAVSATILSAIIAVVFLFSGNIYVIASISNFGLLFSYLMTGFASIHFRRHGKEIPFRIPFYPYSVIIGIIGTMAFMFGLPQEALALGVVMIISLLVVYYLIREYRSMKIIRVRLFR
jgi:basic amino acid/polyamine antiporter, APA family